MSVIGAIAVVSGITLLVYVVIAWRFRKSFSSVEDFFNYNRKMPKRLFSDTFLATNVTFASIYLVIAATTFERGNLTLWIILAWTAGLILFRWLFPRACGFFEKGHTLHEFLGTTFKSDTLRRLASICTIVVFTGTLGIEFWGVVLLLDGIGLSNVMARGLVAVLIAVATAGYTVLGGFKAAVHTDQIQKYLILALGVLLTLISFGILGGLTGFGSTQRIGLLGEFFDLGNMVSDPLFALAMFVMFVPFNFCVMDMWQRCTATSKEDRLTAIRSVGSLKTILTFAFVFGVPVVAGLAARQVSSMLSPGYSMTLLPEFLGLCSATSVVQIMTHAIIYAGFLAALASTADTLLINTAYTFMYDVLAPLRGLDLSSLTENQKDHTIAIFRFWVFVFALLAVPLIFSGLTLYQLVFAVFSSQIVLFVPILYGLLKPHQAAVRGKGAAVSVVAGFTLAVVSVVVGMASGMSELVDGAPLVAFVASLVVFFVVPKSRLKALDGTTEKGGAA